MRPRAGPRLAAAGLALTGLAAVALSALIASGEPVLASRWGLLARLTAWAGVGAVGTVCALNLPRRAALAAVFAIGVAVRLAALAGPPTLSDDLYRYAWDGRVQAAGIDPYERVPASGHLRPLRESWLWPDDAGCQALHRPPQCTRINRPGAHTIYPPLAEAWFAGVYRITGIGAHHKAWQVAGLATEAATLVLIALALRAWGRDPRWTALYALSPLPAVEVVNNGHIDGLAAALVVAALWAAARRRPTLAGALVGAAALVKLYPALLVLALVAVIANRGRLANLLRAGTAAAAVFVAGYGPHAVATGGKVIGFLPGYLREEQYGKGGRYLLAGLLPLPPAVTAALAVAGVLAAAAWVVVKRPPPPRAAALLIGALLLATTPVQPWYAVTLLAVATVAAQPRWAPLAVAAYPYFFAVLLDSPAQTAIGRACYATAAVAAGAALLGTGRRFVAVVEDQPHAQVHGQQDQDRQEDRLHVQG